MFNKFITMLKESKRKKKNSKTEGNLCFFIKIKQVAYCYLLLFSSLFSFFNQALKPRRRLMMPNFFSFLRA